MSAPRVYSRATTRRASARERRAHRRRRRRRRRDARVLWRSRARRRTRATTASRARPFERRNLSFVRDAFDGWSARASRPVRRVVREREREVSSSHRAGGERGACARAVASRGGDPVGGALDSTSFESRLNSGVSDGRRRRDASDGWMRRGVGWMHRDGRCGEKTDDGNVRVFSTRVAQGVRHGVEVEVSRARDTSMAVS